MTVPPAPSAPPGRPGPPSPPPGQVTRDLCVTLDEVQPDRGSSSPVGRRVVVVGGGTFGAVLAAELYRRAGPDLSQVIVLEDGPLLFSGHVQNLPVPGLQVPPPTRRESDLDEQQGRPRQEVWHLPWESPVPFAGLARCVGGRSLYWGAYSPAPCPSELAPPGPGSGPALDWPAPVVEALQHRYFSLASRLLGLDRLYPHYLGPLSASLTAALRTAIDHGQLTGVTPLAGVPDHPAVLAAERAPQAPPPAPWDRMSMRLQLPMAIAVSGAGEHLAFERFSSVPSLAEALADAHEHAAPGQPPRLAVVPDCHVERLLPDSAGGAVTAVRTAHGDLTLTPADTVVLAAGTIENTRLALLSSDNPRIGTNLASHLRSNLVVRLGRDALGLEPRTRLGAASLLVRGQVATAGGRSAHFHHQLTAFGLADELDPGALLALFHMSPRPDVEQLAGLHSETADRVVCCVSSVAQMEACHPGSGIRLGADQDEYGIPRAFVTLQPSDQDQATWDAMDASADELVLSLAAGQDYEVLTETGFAAVRAGQPTRTAGEPAARREPLGSGHHELGSLWLGSDPATSVTSPQCRLWDRPNVYVTGPALFPSLGSSSPVMPGIALALRLAHDLAGLPEASADAGYQLAPDQLDQP
jgi:choline dehydrogenase-like flavoprotein